MGWWAQIHVTCEVLEAGFSRAAIASCLYFGVTLETSNHLPFSFNLFTLVRHSFLLTIRVRVSVAVFFYAVVVQVTPEEMAVKPFFFSLIS